VLHGFEAAKTLNLYAQELENQNGSDNLTNNQIKFLAKAARILSEMMNTAENCSLKIKPAGSDASPANTLQEKPPKTDLSIS
jgi:hypothetical protein